VFEEIKSDIELDKWIKDVLGCLTNGYDDDPSTEEITEIVIYSVRRYESAMSKNERCFLPTFGSLLIRAENQEGRMSMLQESLLFCENCIS
jgi:hypothetical protein